MHTISQVINYRAGRAYVCSVPHRDLSKNFELDIAGELEEYLAELETITISFDNGETNLNFAEAALLIQVWCMY